MPTLSGLLRGAATAVLAGCSALLLHACSGGAPTDRLEDYLARLLRPLDTQRPALGEERPQPPPRWTALQIPIAPGNIDGLDFLKLRGCSLQETVARRNSSLGRVAPPSQRLLLALEFLDRVGDCIGYQRAEGNDALAQLLAESAAQKREQLPALIFNATLGGEEYRDLWRGRELPADYPSSTSSAVIAALEGVTARATRWMRGDYRADGRAFELDLSEIARGDGGELLAALALQANHLDAGSAVLRARAATGPLCVPQRRPRSAEILRTVVTRFFIGEVQPWSAAIAQRQHGLLPPLRALESALAGALPAPYQDWQQTRDNHIALWSAAPRRHVSAIQALLGSCFDEFAAPADT